jgi:uroporphyrinogen decarboxylase
MIENPELVHQLIELTLAHDIRAMQRVVQAGVDVIIFGDDYADKNSPLMSPRHFKEFILPGLKRCVDAAHQAGAYVIKHTDGNIMPILDQLVESSPHALHSIDPMAGVDIAEVKRLVGDRVCLIGNVDCSMLDSGTPDEIAASTRYALQSEMPGGGYIFSTSNCIYTGMPLANYEIMLDVWRKEGNY